MDRYYEGGVSSVYLWDVDDGFAGVVLLKKCQFYVLVVGDARLTTPSILHSERCRRIYRLVGFRCVLAFIEARCPS